MENFLKIVKRAGLFNRDLRVTKRTQITKQEQQHQHKSWF